MLNKLITVGESRLTTALADRLKFLESFYTQKKHTWLKAADSYKFSHYLQYMPGINQMSSYVEPRKGSIYPYVLPFSLQVFLKDYMSTPITAEDVLEKADEMAMHGEPFNKKGFMHIVNEHGGYAPVKIRAIAEGTILPIGNIMVEAVSTDKEVPWIESFIETVMLRAVWYGTTVATADWFAKGFIKEGLRVTSDNVATELPFKLHDFGGRGVSSGESGGLGAAAHLINFLGTDTTEGLAVARDYYGEAIAGFSIPAGEHSTIMSWGPKGEVAYFRNLIKQFGGVHTEGPLKGMRKLFAAPIDTYNTWNCVDNIIGGELRDEIRNCGGRYVARPDSGNPLTVPVEVVSRLGRHFGFTPNSKGFNVLENCIRAIQGDGINSKTIDSSSIVAIIRNMIQAGHSMDNLAFGEGSGMLQEHTRNDANFAMKLNNIKGQNPVTLSDFDIDIYKHTVDDANKVSKRGQQALIKREGKFASIPLKELDGREDHLKDTWVTDSERQNALLVDHKFSDIRKRSEEGMDEHYGELFEGIYDREVAVWRSKQGN